MDARAGVMGAAGACACGVPDAIRLRSGLQTVTSSAGLAASRMPTSQMASTLVLLSMGASVGLEMSAWMLQTKLLAPSACTQRRHRGSQRQLEVTQAAGGGRACLCPVHTNRDACCSVVARGACGILTSVVYELTSLLELLGPPGNWWCRRHASTAHVRHDRASARAHSDHVAAHHSSIRTASTVVEAETVCRCVEMHASVQDKMMASCCSSNWWGSTKTAAAVLALAAKC